MKATKTKGAIKAPISSDVLHRVSHWTRFMDMHSGGRSKEPFQYIYIEAPTQDEAKVIFYNRFGHNPERVSCTCCGEDYSISSSESLRLLTGYDRNCRCLETPRRSDGRYNNDDPVLKAHYYLEDGETPPEGYQVHERLWSSRPWVSLEDYAKSEGVLIIPAEQIKPSERVGALPAQGYVWVD